MNEINLQHAWIANDFPAEVTLAFKRLGKKWVPNVVSVLSRGPIGFNRLREQIPELSAKILSSILSDLAKQGLVTRQVISDSPFRVQYALTPAGVALIPVVDSLKIWARAWPQPTTMEASE